MQVKETALVSVTVTLSVIANATYGLEKNAYSHDEAFSQNKWPLMSTPCVKPFCIIKQCWKSVMESVTVVVFPSKPFHNVVYSRKLTQPFSNSLFKIN